MRLHIIDIIMIVITLISFGWAAYAYFKMRYDFSRDHEEIDPHVADLFEYGNKMKKNSAAKKFTRNLNG